MKLTDILPTEAWTLFEKELFDRFAINGSVFHASGDAVTGIANWCNRLCPEIKGNDDARAMICAPGNQYFMAQADKTRQAVIGQCDAGFFKIAVPLVVKGEYLGIAGGCGLLLENEAIESFMVEKATGMTAQQVSELGRGTPSITTARANQIARFIEQRFAEHVDHYRRRKASAADIAKQEASDAIR